MSARWEPRQRHALAVLIVFLLAAGCIFSPTTKPPPGGGTTVGPAKTPSELIGKLADAYQKRSYDEFQNLFPKAEDNAPYLFLLSDPLPSGETSWGLTDELRIHQRMFNPENPIPGEAPLPDSLWLAGITISLSANRDWEERTDLYSSETNPQGLDKSHWMVVGAEWHAVIFFETQGNTDYSVDGRSYFYVIEDKTKNVGDDRKFLIYRWEDLGTSSPKPVVPAT